jgi:Zn-dependent protease with chaperone function
MRALKTGLLLTSLTLLLVLGGQALAGRQGMTFGLILAVGMNGFAYFFSDKIALSSSGAQPVTREGTKSFPRFGGSDRRPPRTNERRRTGRRHRS